MNEASQFVEFVSVGTIVVEQVRHSVDQNLFVAAEHFRKSTATNATSTSAAVFGGAAAGRSSAVFGGTSVRGSPRGFV